MKNVKELEVGKYYLIRGSLGKVKSTTLNGTAIVIINDYNWIFPIKTDAICLEDDEVDIFEILS